MALASGVGGSATNCRYTDSKSCAPRALGIAKATVFRSLTDVGPGDSCEEAPSFAERISGKDGR